MSVSQQVVVTLQWFARGGAHNNYYMFAGGSNFGRWGGDGITTMYAADGQVCPDGLPHEPKYTHLGNMHRALVRIAPTLLAGPAQVHNATRVVVKGAGTPSTTAIGLAFVYDTATLRSGVGEGSREVEAMLGSEKGSTVAFIEHYSGCVPAGCTVELAGHTSTLPAHSSSLVDLQSGEVLFNTRAVGTAPLGGVRYL
jgi:hypothetical protein